MTLSQERFESIVYAVARERFMDVTVSGFAVLVPKKSRSGRSRYTLSMEYDPTADSWSGIDPYHGGTLPSLAHEISRAMDASGAGR